MTFCDFDSLSIVAINLHRQANQLIGALVKVSDSSDPFFGKSAWVLEAETYECGVWVEVSLIDRCALINNPLSIAHYELTQLQLTYSPETVH